MDNLKNKIRTYFEQGFMVGLLLMLYLLLNKIKLSNKLFKNIIIRFKCRHGYKFWANIQDYWRFIGKDHFEPFLTVLIKDKLSSGKLFIDVGAHIGIHSVHAAKQGAYVIAIEPVHYNYKLLEKNAKINNVDDRIIIVRGGACDKDKEFINIYIHTTSGSHSAVIREGALRYITVPCYTIDSLIRKISKVGIIKIDVEGFEEYVIKGMLNSIRERKFDYIVVEVDHSTENRIRKLLEMYSYSQVGILEHYGNRFNILFRAKRRSL